MKTWLILDCNYLCWRAFHSTRSLSYGGKATGVVFGFLRDIPIFQDLHDTRRIIFTFDCGTSRRKNIYPNYKGDRELRLEKMSQQERADHVELREQITLLRREYLTRIGFRNVFYQKGYEADDVIWSLCNDLPRDHQAIIISADQDLYQLLDDRVIMYNPKEKKAITRESFIRTYGIQPEMWPDVKAIAGCVSDSIKGIEGVGEKTAIKFIQGTLDPEHKAHLKIVSGGKRWRRNLLLTRLPYEGINHFRPHRDRLDEHEWNKLCDELGMKSLRRM